LRGKPIAPEAAAAFRLRFGKNDDAFLHAVAAEFIGDVVSGSGFLENTDVATDRHAGIQQREEVIGVEQIGRAAEAVTAVRAGMNFVTERTEFLDVRPNRGAANAELRGKLGAADRFGGGVAERTKNLAIDSHAI